MKIDRKPPQLFKRNDWEGYSVKDIDAFLGNSSLEFWNWFRGKTGVMDDKKMFVLKADWDRFCWYWGISIG